MSKHVVDAPDAADLGCELARAHQPLVGYGLVHHLAIQLASSGEGSYL